jgi:hypothetical protein
MVYSKKFYSKSWSGGTGRRTGLKIIRIPFLTHANSNKINDMDKGLAPVIYLHKAYTVWQFSKPDGYARETHNPRRQGPRLQAR